MTAISTVSLVDSYGFTRPEDFDEENYEKLISKYMSVLTHRSIRWSKLSITDSKIKKTSTKFKRFVRKGVPSDHRSMIWMVTSSAEERKKHSPDLYKKLLDSPHDEQIIDVIKNDIHRTFPENIYFQDAGSDPNCKRGPLFNVLIAVAHNNKEIGYCQGMNFVSGLLLLIVKDEEKVFWLVDTLLNVILPEYYTPDMNGIKIDCLVLGELVKIKCPDIYNLCESCDCEWSIVTTKWFICLFVDVLPVETVLRLWDCLFLEGDKILFRACIALLKLHQDQLLKCRSFTDLMNVFRKITNDKLTMDCHAFMDSVFKESGSFSRQLLKKLRKECQKRINNEYKH